VGHSGESNRRFGRATAVSTAGVDRPRPPARCFTETRDTIA
jgi:hypothetical protein